MKNRNRRPDDEDPLFKYGEAYARSQDPETAHDAADAMEGTLAARREKQVHDGLRAHPAGLTCHELVRVTGIPYESITPRIAPLRRKAMVEDTGLRRLKPDGSGKPSTVWRAL